MTTGKRRQNQIPPEFLEWLNLNYNWAERQAWYIRWYNTDYPIEEDTIYQYWINNAANNEDIYATYLADWYQNGFITESQADNYWEDFISSGENRRLELIDTLPKTIQFSYSLAESGATSIDDYLKGIAGTGNLQEAITQLANRGYLKDSSEQAQQELYRKHLLSAITNETAQAKTAGTASMLSNTSQDTLNYLYGFTSPQDLASRVNELNADANTKASIYDYILNNAPETGMKLRSAEQTQKEAQQKLRTEWGQEVTGGLNQLLNNPAYQRGDFYTPEKMTPFEEAFLPARIQAGINKTNLRSAREEQTNRALLSGLNPPMGSNLRWEGELPESTTALLNRKIEQEGYAPGTRLRNFLESQLSGIAERTEGPRRSWMEQSLVTDVPTYEDEVQRIQKELEYWNSVAGTASGSPYTSSTYYGAGGLKQIALDAAASARKSLEGLPSEEDYYRDWRPYTGGTTEKDPLIAALNELTNKKLRAEYYRRPGSVPTLSRALRF